MKTLRFAIVGCGLMGREFASAAARWMHLTSMEVRPEIVAVCDTNPSLLGWFTDNIPSVSQATTDYLEVLQNPNVDAVYCAVPHHLHAEIYTKTIAAGKHLLGEKPFGMDAAQNAKINAAIVANPKVLVRCSSEFPFFPGVQRLWRMLQEEDVGRIIEVAAGFWHASDLDTSKAINWKRRVATNGAYGVMGDLGMHVCHVPFRLGWKPNDVRAVLSNIVTTRPDASGQEVPCDTWDNAQLLTTVQHQGHEFPMHLSCKRIAPSETNTWFLRVMATKLSVEFSSKQPKTLRYLPYTNGAPQAWHELDLGYDSVYPTITGGIFEFGFGDAILQMFAAFCDEALGNTPRFACVTPQEAALSHDLFDAALRSHHERAVVVLGES